MLYNSAVFAPHAVRKPTVRFSLPPEPALTKMPASVLLAPVAEDMHAVDAVIRRRLGSEVALINQIGEYIISAGGKRLRPVILLLMANALGYRGQHHYELAAVVEFIHTATLLHDDVVDESELRRGRQTANAVFGNAASVLVGDFLYSRAFQMMVQADSMRVMQILADATNVISEGEVLQLLNMHDPDVTEERYLQVIRYKTAKLFEAAAQIGAVPGRQRRHRSRCRRIRPAHRDRVPDRRRPARLHRDRRPDGQERRRRPARRQTDAAADLSAVARHRDAARWRARPSNRAAPSTSMPSSPPSRHRARSSTRARPPSTRLPQPRKQ